MQEGIEKNIHTHADTPLVSVIIPTYNRTEYLGEAIESVLAQTYPNYEIIVVNDGSKVDVESALAPYWEKIQYIYQENKGLAGARNTGILHSQGKYLAFLDDDDLFEPRKLEVQVQLLELHPEAGLLYSDGYFFDAASPQKILLNHAVGKDAPMSEFSKLFFMNTNIYISALLVGRQRLQELGGFDETLPSHEDSDFILRIALKWPVIFSDYPSTRIRLHWNNRLSHNRIKMNQCILKSWQKILAEHPKFKNELGPRANERLANVHFLLAQQYLWNQQYQDASRELEAYFAAIPQPVWKARMYRILLRCPKQALLFRAVSHGLRLKRFIWQELKNVAVVASPRTEGTKS